MIDYAVDLIQKNSLNKHGITTARSIARALGFRDGRAARPEIKRLIKAGLLEEIALERVYKTRPPKPLKEKGYVLTSLAQEGRRS